MTRNKPKVYSNKHKFIGRFKLLIYKECATENKYKGMHMKKFATIGLAVTLATASQFALADKDIDENS